MTREETILEARKLRSNGKTSTEVGLLLNVSPSTIRTWCTGGNCQDCGAPTYPSGVTGRCLACHLKHIEAPHGSRNRYHNGCRCEDCTRANRDYHRSLKEQTPPTHSASGYINYGCRCDTCREAHTEYMRAIGYKHQRDFAERVRGTEPPPGRHGLYGYMVYRCRCAICTAANTEQSRRYRERKRTRAAS